MAGDSKLGRLERVDLRSAWQSESGDFTPWLALPENLALLGEALGLELELIAQEEQVGQFSADIVCKDTLSGHYVLVENQLERTDHGHLGQLLTYAAGLGAVAIVWVAAEFREEHRAALDWLNEVTTEEAGFFGMVIELYRIGESPMAPRFNVVSRPNDWTRAVQERAKPSQQLTENQALQFDFWQGYRDHLLSSGETKAPKPYPANWVSHGLGRSGYTLVAVANMWHPEKGYAAQELRMELVVAPDNADEAFESLLADRESIEAEVGETLQWYSKEGVRQRRVYLARTVDLTDREKWPEYHEWLHQRLLVFQRVFRERVRSL